MVTSNNDTAITFYRSLGFSFTGRSVPYPNDPDLFEREMMSRPIRAPAFGRLAQRSRDVEADASVAVSRRPGGW